MGELRNEMKAKQAALVRYEKSLIRLEGMINDLKQRELFEDEPVKRSR